MVRTGNDLSVLPIFVLPGQVVFPHERVTLDARTGANISLFAALQSQSPSQDAENTQEPILFAIAPSLDSPVGIVAAVDTDAPKAGWIGGALRLHAVSMFPYELVHVFDPDEEHSELGSWRLDRGFRLCRVRRRYDLSSPHVPFDCFLSLGSGIFGTPGVSISAKASRTRTRSKSKLITKRFSFVVKSSLVDISARAWAAFDETALLKRMRTVATSHERFMQLDEHLLRTVPKDCDTPAKWSYWFAAAMSGHMSEAQQIELLEERVPALRLRLLLRICDSYNPQQACRKTSKVSSGRRQCPQLFQRPKTPAVNTGSSLGLRKKLSAATREAVVMKHPLPIFDKRSFSEIRREQARHQVAAAIAPSKDALAQLQHHDA